MLIDTCSMSNQEFLEWLSGYHGPKKISAVSYMEYLTFLFDKGRTQEWAENFMNKLKINVQYFDKDTAVNAARIIHEMELMKRRCPECNQINWNDTMVASHGLNYSCIIVTENIKDFPFSESLDVRTPEQVMADLSA